MFGRRQEFLNYNVYPSDEGREILAEEALARIETVDGVDYLDGIKIPADNDEIFGGPKTYTISIEKWHTRVNEKGKEEFYATQDKHEFDSTFTNKQAREANIRSIASGNKPLFILWEDVDLSGLHRPTQETFLRELKVCFRS